MIRDPGQRPKSHSKRMHEHSIQPIPLYLSFVFATIGYMNCGYSMSYVENSSFDAESLALLPGLLEAMGNGFSDLPSFNTEVNAQNLLTVLENVAHRMHDNYPYHHPLYAGQMLKPPHPVARLAYTLALWINPNNHALDGGRASSDMEKQAVAEISHMFGWKQHLGHLCGGGTMANMEALWIARNLHPDKMVVASEQAHYTHSRISEVLRLPFTAVPVNSNGQMDVAQLEKIVQNENVGTVIATLGTTGTGSIDPLPDILDLAKQYDLRVHADTAYGGYYTLSSSLSKKARQAYDALSGVDSIVIDPHKHGLQPYGCGCILFRDPSVGRIYKHDSPYTYFSSEDLHLGEISLECSRPGAAAVALYATHQLLPLIRGGEFAGNLDRCRQAALALYTQLKDSPNYRTIFQPELDILVWGPAGTTGAEISNRSRRIFHRAAEHGLHIALIDMPVSLVAPHWPDVTFEDSTVTCLRSCLMKPEHLDWVDRIMEILERIAIDVGTGSSA